MSSYNNGPGNIPRLPARVVDTLIDSAGVSRSAPGRTATTVRDQTAEVERLVHDACEELLARLPSVAATLPAAPVPTTPSTLGQQVARAQAEMAKWSPELRASVRLEGGDAAAPTRATPAQEAEIEAAVKAGRVTFEPGWDEPRADAAPTEQAEEFPSLPMPAIKLHDDGFFTWTDGEPHLARYAGWKGGAFTEDQMTAHARAALAARQSPTEGALHDAVIRARTVMPEGCLIRIEVGKGAWEVGWEDQAGNATMIDGEGNLVDEVRAAIALALAREETQ